MTLTPAQISAEREAFEAWFAGDVVNCRSVERNGDSYKLMAAASAWLAWKARAEQSHAEFEQEPSAFFGGYRLTPKGTPEFFGYINGDYGKHLIEGQPLYARKEKGGSDGTS